MKLALYQLALMRCSLALGASELHIRRVACTEFFDCKNHFLNGIQLEIRRRSERIPEKPRHRIPIRMLQRKESGRYVWITQPNLKINVYVLFSLSPFGRLLGGNKERLPEGSKSVQSQL